MTTHEIEFLTIYVNTHEAGDILAHDYLQKVISKTSTLWYSDGVCTAHPHQLLEHIGGKSYRAKSDVLQFRVIFHRFGVEESHLFHHFEDKGIDDSLSHDIDLLLESYERQEKAVFGFAHFTLAVEVHSYSIYTDYGTDSYIEYDFIGELDFSRIAEICIRPEVKS